jgi:valine--pyruvate aminotransferase
VLFPLAPEYIGYADAGLDDDLFVSTRPNIELLPDGQFKYYVDFAASEYRRRDGDDLRVAPDQPDG